MTQSNMRATFLAMVGEKITKLKSKSKRNKRIFQVTTAGTIALSAAITATLGFDIPEHKEAQKNIALILGLVLTLINGWMVVFDYKKLWIRQKSTLFGLYNIENELKILSDSDSERVKELFNSYQSLWEKDGSEWAHIYSANTDESLKPQN